MDHDRERLRELTEKIQFGDADEGTEALEQIVGLAREQAPDRDAIKQAMREEMVDMRLKAENDRALEKFAKKYPSLREDQVLVEAATHVLRDKIVDDLKSIGIPDDAIAPLRGDTGSLVTAHTQARAKGHKVRGPDDLLNATGAELGKRFNIKPAQRSPAEYVRDMRIQRGLPVREERVEQGGATDYGRSTTFGRLRRPRSAAGEGPPDARNTRIPREPLSRAHVRFRKEQQRRTKTPP